jgi:tetratricopeptide (TPR) repeat protein
MQILTVTSGRYRLMMFPALIYLAAIGACHFHWKKWIAPVLLIFLLCIWKTYSFMGANKAEGTALLAQAHFLKGNYEHAEDLLLFAGKHFKDSSRIDNMLGNIAERKGNIDAARKYYSKVTREEPFMAEGWMNLANVTPDPVKADQFFRNALEAAGSAPAADLTYNYAKFLHAVRNYSKAEEMLKATFKIDSSHVMALNLCGLMAAEKKDFKKAAELFYRAALLKPDEPGFWKNTAIMAQLAGNKKLETDAVQKYLNLRRNKRK